MQLSYKENWEDARERWTAFWEGEMIDRPIMLVTTPAPNSPEIDAPEDYEYHWTDIDHTNITNNGSDAFPAWSPDGKTIAFSREETGNTDIYTINIDGSNLRRLTKAPGPDTLPVYTPRGDIIFRSARSDSWGIWKMSGSGAGQTEIISNSDVGPDWAYSKMDVK